MSRFAPALLVCLLACTSSTRADDAFPNLDQRLGRTITVVEKNFPTEKAVITQVWRLDDGTPCMQALGQTSKTQMTLIENVNAKAAVDRIKIYHWVNGVRPTGCPLPPVVQPTAATVKQTQYETPKAVTASPKNEKVASTEGGLIPVLPKKEEVVATPPTVINQPAPVVTKTLPSINSVPVTPTLPSMHNVPPLPPVTPPATVVVKAPVVKAPVVNTPVSAPAVIKTVPATTIQPPPVPAQPAAQAPAPTVARPELVGGCEVVAVTENGVTRKYKVIGTARDKHGVMTQRCEALDNGEIVTLNCDNCTKCNTAAPAAPCKPVCTTPAPVACAPAPVKCEPAKVVCAPAPVKCEPAKVVCAPAPCKPECKPCDPVKVACEPAKPCVTAPAKACEPCVKDNCGSSCERKSVCDQGCNTPNHDCLGTLKKACAPCKNHNCLDKKCDTCNNSGDCGLFCERRSLFDSGCNHNHFGHDKYGSISVPVPGVRLNAINGIPGGPPPQPLVPAFCTMNSSSIRCYMNAPQIVPFACLNPPFRDGMNSQISAGIYEQNGVNGEAVASTLHLINVLAQSKEWENRQWAAQRLQQATLPTVRPYVEDALVAAAQSDRSPMVKVSAIRTLASLKSTRQDVLVMLSYAVVDEDSRVKEAANEAITILSKSNGVQQTGYAK